MKNFFFLVNLILKTILYTSILGNQINFITLLSLQIRIALAFIFRSRTLLRQNGKTKKVGRKKYNTKRRTPWGGGGVGGLQPSEKNKFIRLVLECHIQFIKRKIYPHNGFSTAINENDTLFSFPSTYILYDVHLKGFHSSF